jgi:hypothetical protein
MSSLVVKKDDMSMFTAVPSYRAGPVRRMEVAMTRMVRHLTLVASLVLLLTITPSWGGPTNPTPSDALGNTAGGTNALQNVVETGTCVTGGCDNTAFGLHALESNTTGDENTAIGAGALGQNNGFANTAIGSATLQNNTTGHDNTASGQSALQFNTNGALNTATGSAALILNDTGHDNTASGSAALLSNTTGFGSTAIGSNALSQSTGNKNIAIGFNAGTNLTSGNNNIYLGNPGVASEFQTIRIGTAQTSTFIAGIASNNSGNAVVVIDTTTRQLGFELIASSARYKRDIAPMGTQSEKVLALRPVTFAYKDEARGATHYGLVAEEVAAVYPELVTRTAAGEVQRVKYQELIPMLLNELQRQQRELAEVAQLRKELTELRALVGSRPGQ